MTQVRNSREALIYPALLPAMDGGLAHHARQCLIQGERVRTCAGLATADQVPHGIDRPFPKKVVALWGAATTLISCLAMSACTSEPQKPNPPAPEERFITNITPEGTKQFTYDLVVQSPKSGGGSGHSGGGHGGMGGGHGGGRHQSSNSDQSSDSGQSQMASKVRDRMEVKLKETHFCSAGYEELGTNLDAGHFQISGRCKDQATAEDRVHFPNTSTGG